MTTPKRPRGRPRLGVEPSERVNVRVTTETLEAVRASLAEDEDESKFIRGAIDRELKRRKRR